MAIQRVPFLDLTRIHKPIQQELEDAVLRVVRSGHYILGEEVAQFEDQLAYYCGVKHAVTCANGTDALELALRATIPVGAWVMIPPFTFGATASSVVAAGMKIRFMDIHEESFCMLPPCIFSQERISYAIMPVAIYGQAHYLRFDYPVMIEDQAQGIGLPVIGDAACLSFFPTKNLGCMGDGGAVLTNRDDVAEKVRLLRSHGARTKYHHEIVGRNSRLDAIQAAILSVKLKYLSTWEDARHDIANTYWCELRDVNGITLPVDIGPHVWNQYTIRIPNRRDEIKEKLSAVGIETMIYYPEPLHLQPAFAHLGYREGDFPEAERACKEVLSLPIYPGLTDKEQDYVIEELKKALDENN